LDSLISRGHAILDNLKDSNEYSSFEEFDESIRDWNKFAEAFLELLVQAAGQLRDQQPTLLADGGVENCNSAVDRLIQSGLLKRLLAQT
jgi:hypothetical protein